MAATAATATIPAASAYSTRSCPCVSFQRFLIHIFIVFPRHKLRYAFVQKLSVAACRNHQQERLSRDLFCRIPEGGWGTRPRAFGDRFRGAASSREKRKQACAFAGRFIRSEQARGEDLYPAAEIRAWRDR